MKKPRSRSNSPHRRSAPSPPAPAAPAAAQPEADLAWPWVLAASVALRFGMLVYGAWQDANLAVPYTDIDYRVFTGAARAVSRGRPPYDRATYRYTPLLAWLLVPGTVLGLEAVWGKLLFVAADLVTGVLVRELAVTAVARCGLPAGSARRRATGLVAAAWLLNPFVANISTRGSAESLMCALCVAVPLLMARGRSFTAAAVLGLAVHLKIYPGVYAIPIAWRILFGYGDAPASWPKRVGRLVAFGGTALAVFAGLSAAMWAVYGWPFVEHTYLYHVTRTDHRHNFSVYFYLMYLSLKDEVATAAAAAVPAASWVALAPFAAQAGVTALLGVATARLDLTVAMFLQTFAFVAFNKVMTSQYFMWWLCYVPVVAVYLSGRVSARTVVVLVAAWVGAQAAWLHQAYWLEFRGMPTFRGLFFAGAALFVVHIAILVVILRRLPRP
ncbi:GPI mannosyltransferase 1 [Blastocladiella emersonii ATCC 22665]|nr:GPI mannosyltransferase 1 [Blastocladiella emersonii ATCC 22665]